MSGSLHAWYSLCDLGALGEHQATLSGEIELHRLARLRGMLHADSGSVRARLRFGHGGSSGSGLAYGGRHGGAHSREHTAYVPLELEFETTVSLLCQRCLEPLDHHLAERVRMALIDAPSMELHVPEGYEPIVLGGDRLMPAALLEDELIVSMPLVPRHARIEQCGGLVPQVGMAAHEGGDASATRSSTKRSTKDCLSPRSH